MQSTGERALWVSLTDAFNTREGRSGFSCTRFCQNHPENKLVKKKKDCLKEGLGEKAADQTLQVWVVKQQRKRIFCVSFVPLLSAALMRT